MSNLLVSINPQSSLSGSFYQQAGWFLVTTYLFSWIIWSIGAWISAGNSADSSFFLFVMIGSFGPSVGAIAITWRFEGFLGLKRLLRTIFVLRFSALHYLFIFLALPIITSVVFWIGGMHPAGDAPVGLLYLTLLISAINGLILIIPSAGPLGEELGWRGYLLPLLLYKFGKGQTNLILGLVWAVWHYPLIIFSPAFRDGFSIPVYMVVYTILAICITVLMTNIWMMSRKSVFIAIWFHSMFNVIGSYSTNSIWDLDSIGLTAIFALVTLATAVTAILSELYVQLVKPT